MKYPQVFIQLKKLQRLFTPWEIMDEPYKLNMMILARKQNSF